MSFEVIYSARARQDLRNIYEYIAYNLLVPETATRQSQRIMKAIRSLNEMPMRYRLYEDEPWHSKEFMDVIRTQQPGHHKIGQLPNTLWVLHARPRDQRKIA